MELIRGISGIRGIVGKSLTNKIASNYISAFSTIQNSGTFLIARDSRSHGKAIIETSSSVLSNSGRTVQNYDIIPTPTAQFLVLKNKLAGGIVVTASHNPKEWNGLKFIDSDGCFLSQEKNEQIFQLVDKNHKIPKYKLSKIESINSGFSDHIQHTINLSSIDKNLIIKKQYNVVVDAVNGAASIALPQLLIALGCNVHCINCEPNGVFSRPTEPLPEHLSDLQKAVIKYKADVGFATDPDGDRLAVVDERGRPLGEEYTLVICADGFLKNTFSKKPIVTNLSTTLAIDKLAEKYGNSVIRSSVGEINVVNKMKEHNALLGGEGNGGIILKESHLGRDSLVGTALFLNRMSQSSKSVSQIFQSMPQFYMEKDQMILEEKRITPLIERIKNNFSEVKQNTEDGLKLIWDNKWIHIRRSNTEPIIRIYSEAISIEEAIKLVKSIKALA